MGSRNTMGVSIFDGVSLPGGKIGELLSTTGRVFYVGSVAVPGGVVGVDNASLGDTPRVPYATIDFAVGQCTADRGDVICVLPNHVETVTGPITVDVAGIGIVGLGVGANRPAITGSGSIDNMTITGARCYVHNLEMIITASGSAFINIAGANVVISGCYFNGAAVPLQGITVPAAGTGFVIEDCYFRGTGNGPDSAIVWEGKAKHWIVRRCVFNYANAGSDLGLLQSSFDANGGAFLDSLVIGSDILVFDFNSSVNAQGDGILAGIRVAAGTDVTALNDLADLGGYNAVDMRASGVAAESGGGVPLVTPA